MNKLFRERNQLLIGAIFLTWLFVLVFGAFNVTAISSSFGREYHALVAEAGGLKASDAVTVNGHQVGKVSEVRLAEKGVHVRFSVTDSDVELGEETAAAIKVATVLGDKELALSPHGEGELAEGSTIPLERTRAPYDVSAALADLTTEAGQVDTKQVAASLDVLSTTLAATPEELDAALGGVHRLARALNKRDNELLELASHSAGFAGVLSDRSRQMKRLVEDGNLLFGELEARKDAIESLLASLEPFAVQLRGLVRDNKDHFGPALDNLNHVIRLLQRNRGNLTQTLRNLSAYSTELGEAVGSGRFFTAKIENILPGNLVPAVPGADENAPDSLLGNLLGGGDR